MPRKEAIEDDTKCKKQGMWLMKIQYGNGVLVVVRARESLAQGEGEQSFRLILNWEGA